MTEKQISKLVGALVEHQSHFIALPKDDAQWVIKNTPDAIKLCVAAIKGRNAGQGRLLEPLGSVTIPAITERFVAKVKFVVNTKDNAQVKINKLSDKFKEWFLAGEGKIEEVKDETSLSYAALLKGSLDGPIIAEIGGEVKAEAMLAEIYELTSQQANRVDGTLLNGSYQPNNFYVRDSAGVMRAVRVYWLDLGWNFDAYSIDDSLRNCVGHQYFFRNSAQSTSEPQAAA